MLSDLLAQRAGKPYDELLRERMFAPLGLRDTLVARNDGLSPGRMSNGLPTPTWDVPVPYAGAGGLRSTIDDLVRLARALRTSRSKLRDAGQAVDIAWAWHLLKRKDRSSLVFHNGMTADAAAMLVLDIEQRRAAITLADAAGGYQLAPQFIISVSGEGGRLYAQATDQERFELPQDSRGDHYAEVADIALRFTGTEGGGAFRATRID
jgi:CubicO group peptidase (beta-lactamase class C family)